jgi:xylulokinase
MGAAMLAAYGSGWFETLQDCANEFIRESVTYQPDPQRTQTYDKLFAVYQDVYGQTAELNRKLAAFRGTH